MKCYYCSKDIGKYSLKRHIESVHFNIRRYVCNICDKAYECLKGLKEHERNQHLNQPIKKWKCEVCGSLFKKRAFLLTHELIHSRDELKCDQCGKDFNQLTNLQQHVRLVHDKLRYPCSECHKELGTKYQLKLHVRAVHEGIRYKCDQCDQSFEYKQKLSLHVRKEHHSQERVNNQLRCLQ